MAPTAKLTHDGAMSRILVIAGRIAALFAIAVPTSFALDILASGAPLPDMLVGLMIQLIPSIVLLTLFGMTWDAPVPGGIVFVLVSGIPLLFLPIPFPTNLVLALPLFVAGLLLLASGLVKD